jgi:hypothetical protein
MGRVMDCAKRLSRLGVEFDTPHEVRRKQKDLLRLLGRSDLDRGYYIGLSDCRHDECGLMNCTDACPFGAQYQRSKEILAAHRLFTEAAEPVFEVRVSRGRWARPVGELAELTLHAAKKLNRRALDKLYSPAVIAVGLVHLVMVDSTAGAAWQPTIHELVSGASADELIKAFSSTRRHDFNPLTVLKVKPEDVGSLLSTVLSRELAVSAELEERTEFYIWSLRRERNERLIRYGCDKYFHRLTKKPRVIRPRVVKKRPYPIWLTPFMFGTHGDRWR